MTRVDALRFSSLMAATWGLFLPASAQAFADSQGKLAAQFSQDDAAPQLRIYGGEEAKVCEFPTAAGGTKKCTATLVHPRVVISAAHCGSHEAIFFGEFRKKPAFTIPTKWCELTSMQSSDAQICVLEKAVTGIPLAPIIQGCESDKIKVGAKVLLSGFGLDENDPANADDSYKNEKRWVETEIVVVKKDAVHIGKNGKGGCNGDSGGPAYLKMDDGSWRTIGATHRGADGGSHPRCKVGIWKRADTLLPWYEEQLRKHGEDDIDLSPCFDEAGKWAPNEHCGGYSKDVRGPHGAWDNNCGQGVPVVEYSATCGPAFEGAGEPKDPKDPGSDSKKDPGTGPTLSFAKPAADSTFKPGPIQVELEVDSEEPVESVTLFLDDKRREEKSDAPYRWIVEFLYEGEHVLRAVVKDRKGRESSKSIGISIKTESGSSTPESGSGSNGKSTPKPGKENKPSQDKPSQLQEPRETDEPGGCKSAAGRGTRPEALALLLLGSMLRRKKRQRQAAR